MHLYGHDCVCQRVHVVVILWAFHESWSRKDDSKVWTQMG